MASLKQIVINKDYVQVNRCEIKSAATRDSQFGKALRYAFLMGPAIDSSIVTVSSRKPDAQQPDAEDRTSPDDSSKDSKTSDTQKDSSNSSHDETNDSGTGNNDSAGQSESYHYSILDAYNNMHYVYEDDATDTQSKVSDADSADSNKSDSNKSDSDKESDKKDSDKESDKKDSDKESDKDNDKKEDNSEDKKFHPGSELYVQVLLKGEGCTVWHIQLDSRVQNLSAIINQLSSKNFKAALSESKKGLGGIDGLVPLSATTYINKNAPANAPFLGHCQYAIDSGSDNAANDANNIIIAIAPIDGVSKGPSERIIYKSVYDINNDFTDGDLPFLKDLKNNNDIHAKIVMTNKNGDEEEATVSKTVSTWLNDSDMFDSVGNTYSNFNKIRDFVVKHIADGSLEQSVDDSSNPKKFSSLSVLKNGKSLIFY